MLFMREFCRMYLMRYVFIQMITNIDFAAAVADESQWNCIQYNTHWGSLNGNAFQQQIHFNNIDGSFLLLFLENYR